MKIFLKAYLASLLAGFTFVFFMFLLLILIPKDEKIVVRKNSVLHLTLNNVITEKSSDDPFSNFDPFTFQSKAPIGLNSLRKAISHAKDDDKIQGIFLDIDGLSAGLSTLKELREMIEDFKASGKFVWAYADYLMQGEYYLASVADSIFFNPSGFMDWHGLASSQPYLPKMFRKIGVKPVVVRGSNNRFKSAVEPFIEEEMSDANREQLTSLLNSLWGEMKATTAVARGLTPDVMQDIADGMLAMIPQNALKLNLVDALVYRTDVYEKLQKITEAKTQRTIPLITAGRYNRGIKDSKTKDKIAVIYAEGEIGMGESRQGNIGPETIVKAIRKAADDDDVKAIVLRVNSPGGSALGSDIMHNELVKAKAKKPLIISMGDLAASGGYFISAPGDAVVAQPTTITGSIGVFMLLFTAEELLEDKIGFHFQTVKTAEMADWSNLTRDLKPSEYLVFQKFVDHTYGDFISRVSVGRGLDSSFVDSIGQGRVWTGIQAKSLGLVDELGGLDVALKIAAEKVDIESYDILELPQPTNPFEQFMKSFSGEEMTKQALKTELGPYYESYLQVNKIMKNQGMMARMPVDIIIR